MCLCVCVCVCVIVCPGETLPLATSNQIMLRFNAKSGQSARGFHFVYQGNSLCSSVNFSHLHTLTHNMLLSFQVQHEILFADNSISKLLPLILFFCGHHCSCASHQWQSVQLSAGASVRQTDRFRVLSWLCGPLRVQSRISAERIQCYPVPGCARCPCTVECISANLYR